MNIVKIRDAVEQILINNPECRDDDNLLILKVWAEQNPMLRDHSTSFVQFSHQFLAGKYASTESIGRCRRKLQEENEALRGRSWRERHDEQENVKQQIKDWHNEESSSS